MSDIHTDAGLRRSRIVMLASVGVAVVMLAFLVVLFVARDSQDGSADSHLLGHPAPAVESDLLGGGSFNLAHRKGSWVIFNFFNSTCVPCIREHDELVKFITEEAKRTDPAELYTVINDDSDDAVNGFFAKNGGDWPKIKDDNGTIAVAFGVAKVPETWIIDPNGFVRMRITGEITTDFLLEKMREFRAQAEVGS